MLGGIDQVSGGGWGLGPGAARPVLAANALSGMQFNLNGAQAGSCFGDWRREVQPECLSKVREGLFFRSPLACDIDFEALGDKPIALARDTSRELLLHSVLPRCQKIACALYHVAVEGTPKGVAYTNRRFHTIKDGYHGKEAGLGHTQHGPYFRDIR